MDDSADTYLYDPHSPVPTVGDESLAWQWPDGAETGPLDQRSVQLREDVLCYTTNLLDSPLKVIGEITAVLFASTSTVDTDFAVKVVDVWPDGRAMLVCDGILRGRYREGFNKPLLLEPERVYRFEIRLVATAMVFGSQHRIRLEVSSSNFPRFDVNANTGGPTLAMAPDQGIAARVTVFHARGRESQLLLPCVYGNRSCINRS